MSDWSSDVCSSDLLTALDRQADPVYDRNAAEKMARLGAHVGAMTPEQLAEWMGKIIA